MSTGVPFLEVKQWVMELTIHLCLLPWLLRMHGAISDLPHSFIARYIIEHRNNFTFAFASKFHCIFDVLASMCGMKQEAEKQETERPCF